MLRRDMSFSFIIGSISYETCVYDNHAAITKSFVAVRHLIRGVVPRSFKEFISSELTKAGRQEARPGLWQSWQGERDNDTNRAGMRGVYENSRSRFAAVGIGLAASGEIAIVRQGKF